MKQQFTHLFMFTKIKLVSMAVVIVTAVMLVGFYTYSTAAIYTFKTVNTSDYSISLPSQWITKPSVINSPKDSPNINIMLRGKQIGRIDVLNYNSTESIEPLLGNHVSRKIKVDKIGKSKVPAIKVILERDWQENKQHFHQYEIHIYFMPGKSVIKYGQDVVYDLSLNSGEIDIQKNPDMKELNEKEAVRKTFDISGIDERSLDKIIQSFVLKD